MITRGREGIGQFAKNSLAVMANFAGFAVEEFGRANDFSSECGADGLMAEANTEDWKFPFETLDEFDGDAGFSGRARAGRNDNAVRFAADNFVHGNFIIAMHFDGATEFAQVLRQVVSERVVVVEQQDHDRAYLA